MPSVGISLGGGLPGTQPPGGLLGGGAGSTGGSGMVGSNNRAMNREVLRSGFGNAAYRLTNDRQVYPLRNLLFTSGVQSTYNQIRTTPFRVAMNAGDINGTVNKPAGLENLPPPSNQVTTIRRASLAGWKLAAGAAQQTGGGSAYVGNPKYVYDGTDYVRYKKLRAINRTYNDSSFGGNDSNAQQQAFRFVRT